jgi:hypothetical protein
LLIRQVLIPGKIRYEGERRLEKIQESEASVLFMLKLCEVHFATSVDITDTQTSKQKKKKKEKEQECMPRLWCWRNDSTVVSSP